MQYLHFANKLLNKKCFSFLSHIQTFCVPSIFESNYTKHLIYTLRTGKKSSAQKLCSSYFPLEKELDEAIGERFCLVVVEGFVKMDKLWPHILPALKCGSPYFTESALQTPHLSPFTQVACGFGKRTRLLRELLRNKN
jgi:hypothetical protein